MKHLFKYFTILVFALSLTSCDAEIEPSAANSVSAIIATILEYLYAIIILIACIIIRIIRIVGIVSIIIASHMLYSNANASIINTYLLLAIGLIVIIGSLCIPVKTYKPHVIISKYAGKQKKEAEKHNKWKDFLYDTCIGLASGIILLIVEHFVF